MSRHHDHLHRSDPGDWDRLYGEGDGESVWSGRPNGALVAEISDASPGRAIDLGCGEGADAIWLASRHWTVTGVDISTVALDRAARAALVAGVEVDWVCADFVVQPPAASAYDLVTTHYPALLRSSADAAIESVLAGVKPGGTLLFVAHADPDPEVAREHGFDPDDYLGPEDIAERLPPGWTVESLEKRPRAGGASERSPHSDDYVLRANRKR